MALTRDQFDVIANSYNDRQLNNKIKLNRRIEEVYEKIPLIKDLASSNAIGTFVLINP